jgi:hypothetical protein
MDRVTATASARHSGASVTICQTRIAMKAYRRRKAARSPAAIREIMWSRRSCSTVGAGIALVGVAASAIIAVPRLAERRSDDRRGLERHGNEHHGTVIFCLAASTVLLAGRPGRAALVRPSFRAALLMALRHGVRPYPRMPDLRGGCQIEEDQSALPIATTANLPYRNTEKASLGSRSRVRSGAPRNQHPGSA